MDEELKDYERKPLPDDTLKDCVKMANKIASTKRGVELMVVLKIILEENAHLTAEVNEHRAVRGYKPLKVYKAV